jgi:hypothetical protein
MYTHQLISGHARLVIKSTSQGATMTLEESLQDLIEYQRKVSRESRREYAKLRRMFQETDLKFKETDRKFQETDLKFKETDRKFQGAERKFQEAERIIQETDRIVQENALQLKETDRQLKETDRRINRVDGKLVNLWGRLVEAIVQPAALKLFNAWGVPVTMSMERLIIERPGYQKEIDILLVNGDSVVVVEVKTTLTTGDVKRFTAFLRRFHEYMPRYRDVHVLGAMACLHAIQSADRHAARQGLFILGLSGDGLMEIRNDAAFVPRCFDVDAS